MPIVGRADQVVFVVCVVSLTTDKEHALAVASGRQGEWLRIPSCRSSGATLPDLGGSPAAHVRSGSSGLKRRSTTYTVRRTASW